MEIGLKKEKQQMEMNKFEMQELYLSTTTLLQPYLNDIGRLKEWLISYDARVHQIVGGTNDKELASNMICNLRKEMKQWLQTHPIDISLEDHLFYIIALAPIITLMEETEEKLFGSAYKH